MKYKYAEVAPAIPLSSRSPQSYTYKIPDLDPPLAKYSLVTVPFGPRHVSGIVTDLHNRRTFPRLKTLTITTRSSLTANQIKFSKWIAHTMHGGLGYTLRLCTAPGAAPKKISAPTTGTKRTRSHPDAVRLISIDQQNIAYVQSDRSRRHQILGDYIKSSPHHQVLILVPERWRTSEMYAVIADRLNQETVIFHGQIPGSTRNQIWHRINQGQPLVVVGTQTALFLPWQKLSLVIIEEEFNPSHKLWDQYPRLNNIDALAQLALIHQAKYISSSSMLSLRQFYQSEKKELTLQDQSVAIKTKIHELTFEDRRRHRTMPTTFIESLRKWRNQRQQVLIYYNRLSSTSLLCCSKCSGAARCQACQAVITTTVSKLSTNKLPCPQCHASYKPADICQKCHQPMRLISTGLKKIDTLIEQLVTDNIWHINAQTMRQLKSDQLQKKLSKFDIIISTAAIFTAVPPYKFDQVIWLYPEQELLYPDYRSLESGRYTLARLKDLTDSSRRPIHLVTRQAHFIERELTSPLKPFYKRMLKERQKLHYPPLTDIVRLTISHLNDKTAQTKAAKNHQIIKNQIAANSHQSKIQIRGPFQSLRKKTTPEYHILLTGPLDLLLPYYESLDIDRAELSPHTII